MTSPIPARGSTASRPAERRPWVVGASLHHRRSLAARVGDQVIRARTLLWVWRARAGTVSADARRPVTAGDRRQNVGGTRETGAHCPLGTGPLDLCGSLARGKCLATERTRWFLSAWRERNVDRGSCARRGRLHTRASQFGCRGDAPYDIAHDARALGNPVSHTFRA